MFRRRPQGTAPVSQRLAPPVAGEEQLVPVLTRAEVLAVVNLLEECVALSTKTECADLAGTLIVRLLDRLRTTEPAGA